MNERIEKVFLVQRAMKFVTGDVMVLTVDQFNDMQGAQEYVSTANEEAQRIIAGEKEAFGLCGIVSVGHGIREVEVKVGSRIQLATNVPGFNGTH